MEELIAILSLCCCFVVNGQSDSTSSEIDWIKGPTKAAIGQIAEVSIPVDYIFANPKDTRTLLESMQNPTSGDELGLIAPSSFKWFAVYEFSSVGFVKDDEKDKLDADAILKNLKESTAIGNKEREKRGWPPINIIGWLQMPNYSELTHNLEWATRAITDNQEVINFNTRYLGRHGVMRVTLVSDPTIFESILPDFRSTMSSFAFTVNNKYSEFRQGDKIAEYGLTGLMVGGAAAVAAKAGIFKWLWKLIVFAFIAGASFFKKIFNRITGKE